MVKMIKSLIQRSLLNDCYRNIEKLIVLVAPQIVFNPCRSQGPRHFIAFDKYHMKLYEFLALSDGLQYQAVGARRAHRQYTF